RALPDHLQSSFGGAPADFGHTHLTRTTISTLLRWGCLRERLASRQSIDGKRVVIRGCHGTTRLHATILDFASDADAQRGDVLKTCLPSRFDQASNTGFLGA